MCAWKTKQKVLFILLCRIVFLFSMPITAKQGGEKSAVVFGGVMEYSTDIKGEAHIAERKIMCMDFSAAQRQGLDPSRVASTTVLLGGRSWAPGACLWCKADFGEHLQSSFNLQG